MVRSHRESYYWLLRSVGPTRKIKNQIKGATNSEKCVQMKPEKDQSAYTIYRKHPLNMQFSSLLLGSQTLTVISNFVKEDMSITHTASLQHLTSDSTMSNQSGL